MATTDKGAPYPSEGGSNNAPADIKLLAEWVDARPGTSTLTASARASLAGADLWEGREVFESDTDRLMVYTGAAWRRVPVEATTDGAWQTYTPTHWGWTPAPTPASARYRLVAKTLEWDVRYGSVTPPSAFFVTISPPVMPAPHIAAGVGFLNGRVLFSGTPLGSYSAQGSGHARLLQNGTGPWYIAGYHDNGAPIGPASHSAFSSLVFVGSCEIS